MTEILIKILSFGTFSCVLLSLAIEDHRENKLRNCITLPLVASGLVFNSTAIFVPFQSSILGAMLGYFSIRALHDLQVSLRGSSGIGLGDAKFLSALGAWFGLQAVPICVVGASIVMLTVYSRRQEKPFGVGLSLIAVGIASHHIFTA